MHKPVNPRYKVGLVAMGLNVYMTKIRDKILDLHDILSCKTLLRDTLCDKTVRYLNTPACIDNA